MDLMKFLENNWFTITLLGTMIATTVKLTQKIDSFIIETKENNQKILTQVDSSNKELNRRIDDLTSRIDKNELRRQEGSQRTRIILTAVEATLCALHDEGHNGPVSASLNEIRDFKDRKASE
jgi:uncharacterized protein YlxW (UPF0749 family)